MARYEVTTARPESVSTAEMNRSCIARWNALRLSYERGALELDQRLLDVGVDAAEHAGQQVVTHHLTLGRARRAVVVPLVEHDHRLGDR